VGFAGGTYCPHEPANIPLALLSSRSPNCGTIRRSRCAASCRRAVAAAPPRAVVRSPLADRLLDDFLRLADAHGSFRQTLVALASLQAVTRATGSRPRLSCAPWMAGSPRRCPRPRMLGPRALPPPLFWLGGRAPRFRQWGPRSTIVAARRPCGHMPQQHPCVRACIKARVALSS